MSFFAELKRRNVVRVGIAYLVAAWLLIQVADIIFEAIGSPPWVMQTLLAVLVIGFFLALFFAWAFELTPEGVKRERDVDRSQSITPATGKKINNTIVILLAIAVAYLLIDKFSAPARPGSDHLSQQDTGQTNAGQEKSAPTPVEAIAQAQTEEEPTISKKSIAVLPFDNRSNREEDQFFTDGIHDDLLTTIARIGSMKVISRTSVMEYRDTTKKLPEIAKELGVANILEGGIQRSGDHVRINVQLIDANTDEHLWAEIFDRELTANNLFAIQSEISKAIAEALQATLSPEEERRIDTNPTDNLLALDAYLRGRQLMATRESAKLEAAIGEFNKAVELDPQFALAWVGVADSNYLLTRYGTLPRDEAITNSENAIERAFAIDDSLGEAYASLGLIKYARNQHEDAETAYKKAIELNPNYATAYQWYAILVGNFPLRIDEQMDLIEKAVELDPRSRVIASNLATTYQSRGLYSLAERQFQKVIELNPGSPQTHALFASLYIYNMGRYEPALFHALKAVEFDPGGMGHLSVLFDIYVDLGDLPAAEMVRERMTELDANHVAVGYADVSLNVYRHNPAGIRESVNWLLPRIRDDLEVTMWQAANYLIVGDNERAREIYLSTAPGWLDPDQWQELLGLYSLHGCILPWVLINTGDTDLGRQLLQQATTFHDQTLPSVNEHADWSGVELCYLTAGDTEKALQVVETHLAHNHLNDWQSFHQLPMYELIRDEPRYQAAVAERKRRIRVQHEAIEAGGKL